MAPYRDKSLPLAVGDNHRGLAQCVRFAHYRRESEEPMKDGSEIASDNAGT